MVKTSLASLPENIFNIAKTSIRVNTKPSSIYYVLENYFYFKSTCSKNIFTIVNKQSKNLFLIYYYGNIYC
jgi:hypothetical protein